MGSDGLFVLAQHALPHHLLSRLMMALTRCRSRVLKDSLIRWFLRRYQVDLGLAEGGDPSAYRDFNSFFTRALREGARPVADSPGDLACPVDGTVSQAGQIRGEQLFQAKGRDYDLVRLLGGDEARARPFRGGSFATLYLSPRDYHRIHMPLAGVLREMVCVPGRLFSVNPRTTRLVPGLFTRNERVATLFETAAGPMALVLVGAVFVGCIETVWHGVVTPPSARDVRVWTYADRPIRLEKGEEMGRFNMGSTVIALFGPGAVQWAAALQPGAAVVMGKKMGQVVEPASSPDPDRARRISEDGL